MNHDPMCPVRTMAPGEGGCYCGLIEKVRADERNLIWLTFVRRAIEGELRLKLEALIAADMDYIPAAEVLRILDDMG